MQKRFLMPALLFLFLLFVCAPAQAAPGDVLTGEYVMIVNTDLSDATEDGNGNWVDLPQKSGTIFFDAAAGAQLSTLSMMDAGALMQASSAIDSSGLIAMQSLNAGASYTVGQTKSIGGKRYTLTGIGAHCFIWMDATVTNAYTAAGENYYTAGASAAAVYDEKSYPVLRQFDATGLLYYADGSGKLSILMEANISSGYFDYTDMFTDNGNVTAIHVNGSKHPMDFSSFGPLFAHEGQHAVSYCMESGNSYSYMNLWLNEALSVAAMDTYTQGHDGNGWLNGMIDTSAYLQAGRSFVYASYPGYTESNYSMPFLFLRYLNTQAHHGYDWRGDFYSKFYQASAAELGSIYNTPWRRYDANRVEHVLRQYAPTASWDFKQALVNFYVAVQVQANNGIYGFCGDPIISRKISGFPVYGGASGRAVDIEKCGAILVKTINGSFTVPADAGPDIVFTAFSPNDYERGLATAGTADEPHLVANAEELSYIWDAAYRDDYFLVTNDFTADAGYYDFWADNYYNYYMTEAQRHWPEFYGVLDGDGHTISNLTRPLCSDNYGLIENLSVRCDIPVSGSLTGGIANMNYGTIQDCAVHGSITLPDTISSYYAEQYAWIGGVAGDMRTRTPANAYTPCIRRCMSDVTITGELDVFKYFYIGGVVGSSGLPAGMTDLSDCYSNATLSLSIKDKLPSAMALGGLVGSNNGALTQACYSAASISFTNENGGDTSGKLYIGRVFGRASNYAATYQNIYSLEGLAACGSYTPDGVATLSEAAMKTQAAFTGFDFQSVWSPPDASAAYPFPTLRAAAEHVLIGDLNQDSLITVADGIFICRIIAGLSQPPAKARTLADVNKDGDVNVADVILLCRYIAGIVTSF